MKTFKLLFISLVSLGLLMIGPAKAALNTFEDVTTDAYQYVNEDPTFTDQTITGVTTQAWYWEGSNTTISEGGDGLIANLNTFLTDNGGAATSLTSYEKVDGLSGLDGVINQSVFGILLKASTESLFVEYSELVGNPLYWNTLFSSNPQGDPQDLSFYVIFDGVIPIPAALWLFAPALLGMLGIRRKYSA
jgi:hypothetical protein